MLWQVRALLDDRPGAMAALAARCGQQNVNILGLQIFPAADGRVVDELVLHTPGGWAAGDVEQLCLQAGVDGAAVAACSPHALEDQPVRYLRAAQAVADEPGRLEEQLCRLLDASPLAGGAVAGDAAGGRLLLDDADGPPVRLSRPLAFTDTERARSRELRRLAGSSAGGGGHLSGASGPAGASGASVAGWDALMVAEPAGDVAMAPLVAAPVGSGAVTLRAGSVEDAGRVVAMHARCSSRTIVQRYHAPLPRLSDRLARALLEPSGGLSILATVDGEVVAFGILSEGPSGPELGLLVEDHWQRQGLGTKLLRSLAVEAANRGATSVVCTVQPGNTAVLATVRRAALRAHVTSSDGMMQVTIPVAKLVDAPHKRHNRPAMGAVTTPLVALLHERRELREVYPPADLLDQAVRGGA